ncbi:MAG: glutamine--fructose-6-phosphate transaminase (isomerizing) [Candidatus Methanomethylicia archaeon]
MCGIIGFIGMGDIANKIVLEGLKRLEYRGYDSVGIAMICSDNRLVVKKDAGKIDEVHLKLNFLEPKSNLIIGHVRWATHGAPTMENAHPHVDCSGGIAVVHNGVIENFLELKRELEDKGHRFRSRTDTEVIPHLIEDEIKAGRSLYEAVLHTVRKLKGSYAIAVISTFEPDKIICARNESPLIIGFSDNAFYCASDIPAILPYTRVFSSMDNGEIAILTVNGVEFKSISNGESISKKTFSVDWSIELAEKQGYPHFMLKEIHEQPLSLRNALRLQEQYLDLLARFIDRGERVFLVACGTSYHACLAASYMFSKIAKVAAFPVIASEFLEQYGEAIGIDDVMLAVSQSGETYDVLKAVDHARMKAATILGLTNTVGSTLTRVSRAYIVQQSGPEIGVAATKTFTAQLLVLAQLAMKVANLRGKLSQQESDFLRDNLRKMPDVISEVLNSCEEKIKKLAKIYAKKNLFLFLGRGINVATALEGRLKLLEITYIPSLAFSAAESKHGPISIIESGIPVIFIAPRDSTRKDIIGNIMEMKARGAETIILCEEGDKELIELANHHIPMPKGIPEILTPIPYIIPLQLLAYYISVERGLDPDKPRNLAKSVTVP